jgi:hypothetical protein
MAYRRISPILPPAKESPLPIKKEATWIPQLVCTFWFLYLALPGVKPWTVQAHSLVMILNELNEH